MIKITIANTKGGVGKTTIATNFACIAANVGKKTILIDSDIQESSMKFRAIRPDIAPHFQAVSILTPTIHKDINHFGVDIALIDAGGRDSTVFRSSLLAADYIIVPLLPSQYDVWSSEETFKTIEEIRDLNEKIKVGVIINQVIAGTSIAKDVINAMNDYIDRYKLHLFKTLLYSRVAYKESVSEGKAVTEFAHSKYKHAKEEMLNLFNEVLSWL